MDNLNTHSEQANQPQGQQPNGLLAVPTSLDSHMIEEQQGTNLAPFWISLEQHRLQLDQLVQLYNEQVQVSLQQEMSIQNATRLNLLTTNALIQKDEVIASLCVELQRKQEDLETALQLPVMAYEMNGSPISMRAPVQQEINSHVSSNEIHAPGPGDEASSVTRTAAVAAQPNLICKVCNSGVACMLLLPCQHLCACKACGVRLMACPACGAVKGDAIEARFC